MRNTMPGAYTAVPVTFAGMAVTLPESLRSRSPESSVTLPESPVTFDRNTHNPNQVVVWRRAFDEGGVAALESRRQARPMKAENPNPEPPDADSPSSHSALREEVERLRAEVAYLKKLQALVRERQAAQKERKPSSN